MFCCFGDLVCLILLVPAVCGLCALELSGVGIWLLRFCCFRCCLAIRLGDFCFVGLIVLLRFCFVYMVMLLSMCLRVGVVCLYDLRCVWFVGLDLVVLVVVGVACRIGSLSK